jgi:hypothetical protein
LVQRVFTVIANVRLGYSGYATLHRYSCPGRDDLGHEAAWDAGLQLDDVQERVGRALDGPSMFRAGCDATP